MEKPFEEAEVLDGDYIWCDGIMQRVGRRKE